MHCTGGGEQRQTFFRFIKNTLSTRSDFLTLFSFFFSLSRGGDSYIFSEINFVLWQLPQPGTKVGRVQINNPNYTLSFFMSLCLLGAKRNFFSGVLDDSSLEEEEASGNDSSRAYKSDTRYTS